MQASEAEVSRLSKAVAEQAQETLHIKASLTAADKTQAELHQVT